MQESYEIRKQEKEKREAVIKQITDSENLKIHGLKYRGEGASSVCFETSGSIKKLVKVNKNIFWNKIQRILADPINNTEDSFQEKKPHSEQIEGIQKYKEQEKILEDVFGENHVLKKNVFRTKIPLTREVIEVFAKNYFLKNPRALESIDSALSNLSYGKVYQIEMLIETQTIARELDKEKIESYKTQDFSFPLIRGDIFFKIKNSSDRLKSVDEMVDSWIDDGFQSLHKEYLPVLKDMMERFIEYTKRTGLILDIFGSNNITMFTGEDGKSGYRLLDVVGSNHWNENIKEDSKKELMREYYVYYRSLNKMAQKLGINKRLELNDLVYFKNSGLNESNISEYETVN